MRVTGRPADVVGFTLFRATYALDAVGYLQSCNRLIAVLHKHCAVEDAQFRARIVAEIPADQVTNELLEVAVDRAKCGPVEWLKSKPAAVSLELWLRIYELVPPAVYAAGVSVFSEYAQHLSRALYHSKRSPYVRTRDG